MEAKEREDFLRQRVVRMPKAAKGSNEIGVKSSLASQSNLCQTYIGGAVGTVARHQ